MLRGCLLDKLYVSDENVVVQIKLFSLFVLCFFFVLLLLSFSFLLFPMLSLPGSTSFRYALTTLFSV